MDTVVLAAQLVVAAVFATAGVAKLRDMPGTRTALSGFGIAPGVAHRAAPLLPLSELAVAAALVPATTARWGAVGAVVLLAAFSAGIVNALAQGRAPDCGCFGNLHSAQVGWPMLVRNAGLAALAGFVVVAAPDVEIGDWLGERSAAELVAIGSGVAALTLLAVLLRLLSYNRSLQRQLYDARLALENAPDPPGLPIGAPPPAFELSTLRGGRQSLAGLRATDRPVLLFFFDPNCGPCWDLRSDLSRWQAALAEQMAIVVISGGTVERNDFVWTDHAAEVLLEGEARETSTAYRVRAWPQLVAIGRDGRIAYEPVTSADAMEVVIRAMLGDTVPAAGSRETAPVELDPANA